MLFNINDFNPIIYKMSNSSLDLELVAKTCHEVNRQYCIGVGDEVQPMWKHLPKDLKDIYINGVLFIMDNPRSTAKSVHDNWVKDKIKDGWAYGTVKDPIKKTHPCIVNYHTLSKKQRTKDKIFREIVKSFY